MVAAALALLLGAAAFAQAPKKTVAILVRNDSAKYVKFLDANKKNLENYLAADINNSGFGVISMDLVLRNLNSYLNDDNAKYRNVAETLKRDISTNKKFDQELFENISGINLAEMVGADYILVASIASVSEKRITSNLYGVKTVNNIFTMRCNYNLCESGMGVGTSGKSVKSEKLIRNTENMNVEVDEEFFNELMQDCATQMAQALAGDLNNKKIIAKIGNNFDVYISVKVTAMRFPQVFQEDDGSYAIEESMVPLELMTINAEIDGISHTINTNTPIKLKRGPHHLRISHKDLEPIDVAINVTGIASQDRHTYEGILTAAAKERLKKDMEWMQATVEKYKDSANKDKIREIELERRRTLARSESADVDIKIDNAKVDIAQRQAQMEIDKNYAAADVARINSQTKTDAKIAQAQIRAMDAETANSKKMTDAYVEESQANSTAKIILSQAEYLKAKGIFEALKKSGFKIDAKVKIP